MACAIRSSRRGYIAGTTTALAAGAMAQWAPSAVRAASDHDLLDVLVMVERAQFALYSMLLAQFPAATFAAAGFVADERSRLETLLTAEEMHLAVLGASRSNPDLSDSGWRFPADLVEALAQATELESLAVTAYAGVIPLLRRQRQVARLVGIHSVEARHAAWLAGLIGSDPFPAAIDAAIAPDDVLSHLAAIAGTPIASGTPASDTEGLAPAIAAIAVDQGIAEDAVAVNAVEKREWPDSSLGCSQEGQVYLDVITPGFLINVEIDGESLTYHADEQGNTVRCP